MDNSPVNVYYNYYNKDIDDFVGTQENNISLEQAEKIFDNYPWSDELIALEQRGESGGINYYKGDYNDVHTSLSIYVEEDNKVSIDLDICAKKGFLGIFGNKEAFKDFSLLDYDDAKVVIKKIFKYNEDELYNMYN